MGRIPAAVEARRPAPVAAPLDGDPFPTFPAIHGAGVRGFRLTRAPLPERLALPVRRSVGRTAREIGIAALGALAAAQVAALLLESHDVAATAALLVAVMLGAWRGFWSGVTAALLTTAGLSLRVTAADGSPSAMVVDLALFMGLACLILARCGWQERRAARLLTAALHDPLTGLLNRAALLDGLEQGCSAAAAGGPGVALISLDIDDFKAVNDRFGHAAGDDLLCAVAGRLAARLRPGDLAARQGGDEFALLLAPGATLDDAVAVARRLLAALDEPFVIGGRTLRVTASAGASLARGFDAEAARLLEQADMALYQAKRSGKARAVAYRPAPAPSAR